MKASELQTKTVAELEAQLAETQTALVEARRMQAAGELTNPRVITNHRRDIARIQTVLRMQRHADKKEEA